jgi:beta-carotene ketolase (CrtO type)
VRPLDVIDRIGDEHRTDQVLVAVIPALEARRVFLHLVEAADVDGADPSLRERVERKIINGNETILKIDCALTEPPRFERWDHRDEYLIGSVLIADSVDHVERAHVGPDLGDIPDADPSMYVVVPTVLDPTMAPQGKHTLWIEFFAPYQIRGAEGTGPNGTGWTEQVKDRVADRVLDKLAEYAPNLKRAIVARQVESPADLAARLGAIKGNYYHMDMSVDQMLFFRPLPELANYKTPIEGLYLTGAGTHPGGSVSGMPGRNCARVVIGEQQSPLKVLGRAGESLKAALSGHSDG